MKKCSFLGVLTMVAVWFGMPTQIHANNRIEVVPATYRLSAVNWETTSHSRNDTLFVGGYSRYPAVGWDEEGLLVFDLSTLPENIAEAYLEVAVVGGTTNGFKELKLYDQTIRDSVDTANVSYGTFCQSQTDCGNWDHLLASAMVDASSPGVLSLSSPALLDSLRSWKQQGKVARSAVLASNFHTRDYRVELAEIKLVVVEGPGYSSSAELSSSSQEQRPLVDTALAFPAARYPLVQQNWNGSAHLTSDYVSIGGYARYQPFGYEMLVQFDVPDLAGEIVDAKITLRVVENSVGSSQTIFLYAQDKDSSWDASNVTYDTFGREPWDDVLAVTELPGTMVSNVVFSGGALTARVNEWKKNPNSNKGVIVAGSFGHWDSFVIADSVWVELAYRQQLDTATANPGRHSRLYSHSFEHGNLISNWSFENVGGWEIDPGRADYDMRASQRRKLLARSGTHFATVEATPFSGAPNVRLLSTGKIPVAPEAIYSLTFHYAGQANAAPYVEFFRCESCDAEHSISGDQYINVSSWQREHLPFIPPDWATHMRVVLLAGDSTLNASLRFDDVVLEEVDPSDARTGRIGEVVDFHDSFGRLHQTSALTKSALASDDRIGSCLEARLVYARSGMTVGNRTVLFGGTVTAEGPITIGNDATISTNLHSKNRIELFNRTSVKGDVRAGENIVLHQEASISAQTVTQGDLSVPSCSELSDGPWPESYQDVVVPEDTTMSLLPGNYRDLSTVTSFRPSVLKLRHGVYTFRTIRLFGAARIEADLSDGDIEIYVSDSLQIGFDALISSVNAALFSELTFHVRGDVEILADVRLSANVISDSARIRIGNRVLVEGRVVGGQVEIGEDCVLSAPKSFEPSAKTATYLNAATVFDEYGRKKRASLPFLAAMSSPGVLEHPIDDANAFYDASGAYGDAEGFAYSEFEYVQGEPGDRLASQSSPGQPWAMENHPTRLGTRYVSSLDIPSVLTESADSAAHACDTIVYGLGLRVLGTDCADALDLSWKINPQGLAELSWRDLRGRELQRALVPVREDSVLMKDSALVRRFEYYPDGTLRRELTPVDLLSGDSAFAVTRAYDAAGRLSLMRSKDGGLVRFVRDRAGRLRFSQDERQRDAGIWSYNEYDARGNPVSVGTQSFTSSPTVAQADSSASPAPKTEYLHYYYGPKGLAEARLRFPFLSNVPLLNVGTRLAIRVALNPDVRLPSALSQEQKTPIVADLYSYDSLGRLKTVFRFDGMGDGPGKTASLTYEYDPYGRLKGDVFRMAADRDSVLARDFVYDDRGRIVAIFERGGPQIAGYGYDDLGRLTVSRTGEAVERRSEMSFLGNVVKFDVRALSDGNPIFSQEMFYEKADSSLGMKPRLDGRLAGERVLRDSLLSDSGELRTMDYDSWGRFAKRSVSKATGGGAWTPNDSLGETVRFDGNGRILEKGMGEGNPLSYSYGEGLYRPYGVGNDSTLVWDGSGRLVEDRSKRMSVRWAEGNRPVSVSVVSEDSASTALHYYVYDADGRRTATVSAQVLNGSPQADTVLVSVVRDVLISGHRAREVSAPGQQALTEVTLRGASGAVGRLILPGTQREYFVRDIRGSVVRTVDADGHPASWGFRYGTFGVRGDLAASTAIRPPRNQYTGHEWDATTGLIYFGSRYYDPELGLWLSPDPATQLANPYSPMGGDPINYVDPDGESALLLTILTGAAIGALFAAAGEAYKQREDWWHVQDWDWSRIGMSAAMGAAGAAGGYGAGALGLGLTAELAASSTGSSVAHYALNGFDGDIKTNVVIGNICWNCTDTFDFFHEDNEGSVDLFVDIMNILRPIIDIAGIDFSNRQPDSKAEQKRLLEAMDKTNRAMAGKKEWGVPGFTGDYALFGTNKIGANNQPGMPVDFSDFGAWIHDDRYDALNISGVGGAFYNISAVSADLELIGYEFSVPWMNPSNMYFSSSASYSRFIDASHGISTGIGFSGILSIKTLQFYNSIQRSF